MNLGVTSSLSLMMLVIIVSGCNSPVRIKSTTYTPLASQTATIAEPELLDLGVLPFDPGLEDADADDDEAPVLAAVRNAEAHYLASQLVKTVQDSAAWGAVRVLPTSDVVTDVYVRSAIQHSDGEVLELKISVADTSGREWYSKNYRGVASKYAYERRKNLRRDPFQSLFNEIANDLLLWRQKLSPEQAINLRTVSALLFARDCAPQAFSEHLQTERNGQLTIRRLPASNDPILSRVERMRERDYLYVDTVQEYYEAFARRMAGPYQSWREQSYEEVLAARDLKKQSIQRTAGGVAAILVGILASTSDSGSARAGGAVAIGSGALLVKSGLAKKAEAQIHIEALAELGQSLEAEVEPKVIELEDQTVTLTGNVEMQYKQWQELLQQIYRAERADI
jgi:hypothetical protein